MGAQRDHERGAPGRRQQLGATQGVSAISSAAVDQKYARSLIWAIDEPCAELLAVAGLDSLGFDLPPGDLRSGLVSPGVLAPGESICDCQRNEQPDHGHDAQEDNPPLGPRTQLKSERGNRHRVRLKKRCRSDPRRVDIRSFVDDSCVGKHTWCGYYFNERVAARGARVLILGRGLMSVPDRRWRAWVAAAWAVAIGGFAIHAQNPPQALPAHAAETLFAAGRAQKHVEAIARAPHPMGSEESKRVRDTLVGRLEEIGLTAEIQRPKRHNPPMPQNVLARIKGQGPSGKKALMLCAHYDSVSTGPGASDNGAGVAVVLETLRALQAGPPLERDVIALFPDGEENGFHGSRLFVDEHRWAKDVSVVLNFDARGNSGPSIMFETSAGNGWLIRQYAQAVPQPLATSLSMDVYQILPNDTDLTVFKQAGMGGLNFAFGAGLAYYHSPEDTPENLDQGTLQHQGENALATARHLGRLDLDDTKQEDVIYTSILNRAVLAYSKGWILPLALFALTLFLSLLITCVQRAEIGLGDVAVGAGVVFLAIAASLLETGILWLLGAGWSVLRDVSSRPAIPWLKYDVAIMTVCALLTAAITMGLARWWSDRRPFLGLVLGGFSWWLALSLATAIWLPGASYFFVWPTICGLLGLCISIRLAPGSLMAWGITLACSVPSLLVVAPLIRATFDGLGLPLISPIMILVVLFTEVLMPIWGPLVLQKPDREQPLEMINSTNVLLQVEHVS